MPTPEAPNESLYHCLDFQTKKEISISQQSNNYVRIYSVRLKKKWANGSLLPELTETTKVAMKEITRGAGDLSKTEICRREFERLKDLSHDNIVIVYEALLQVNHNDPSSLPSYLMEIGECSLTFVLRHKRQDSTFIVPVLSDDSTEIDAATNIYYTKKHLFAWLKQLADALLYLHNKGLIHRDVKGENALLFNKKTTCKLCDFDTCREIDPEGMTPKVGTDRWRAPEMRKPPGDDKVRYNEACDAYSFGVLICEAIFREKPFLDYLDSNFTAHDEDIPIILPDQASGAMLINKSNKVPIVEVIQLKSVFANLPKEFWDMLNKLLSWSPEGRPCFEEICRILNDFSPDGDLPMIIVSEVGQKTDTGSLAEMEVPSRRRRPFVTKRIKYSLSLDLEPDDQEQLISVLRELSKRINVYATVPNDQLHKVHHDYSFTQSKKLAHDIKCADQQLVDQVFECCTRPEKRFSSWLEGIFEYEPKVRLRGMKFALCSEQFRVED